MSIKDFHEERRPADLWFWKDWFSSFDLRACSLAARGLWMDMLGVMRAAETKGVLSNNGKQIDSKALAKIVGVSEDEVIPLLKELEDRDVFSRLEDGTIINRRMYRESELSRTRAEAGKKGGLSRWQTDSKGGSKPDSKPIATYECDNEYAILLTLKEDIKYLWCEFARQHGLTEIKDIQKGGKREKTLGARLKEEGFDFKALLLEVKASPFLLGKKTDFKATFDWILAPSNYQKIMEGNYRGTTPLDGPREWLKQQEEKEHGND